MHPCSAFGLARGVHNNAHTSSSLWGKPPYPFNCLAMRPSMPVQLPNYEALVLQCPLSSSASLWIYWNILKLPGSLDVRALWRGCNDFMKIWERLQRFVRHNCSHLDGGLTYAIVMIIQFLTETVLGSINCRFQQLLFCIQTGFFLPRKLNWEIPWKLDGIDTDCLYFLLVLVEGTLQITVQYHTLQYNTVKYHTLQYSTVQMFWEFRMGRVKNTQKIWLLLLKIFKN